MARRTLYSDTDYGLPAALIKHRIHPRTAHFLSTLMKNGSGIWVSKLN